MAKSQGAASNNNGKSLERQVEALLVKEGFPFESQIKRYPGPNPSGHKHDFVVKTPGGPVVIECKSFSGQTGTIWEKIPYTISVLSRHGVRSVLVLGGKVPTDWKFSYLVSVGAAHGVKVIEVQDLMRELGG